MFLCVFLEGFLEICLNRRKIYKGCCLRNYKMFGFFNRKREIEKLRGEVQDSFNHVKTDFGKVGEWIKHIDGKHEVQKKDLNDLKEQLFSIQTDLEEVKDFISFFGGQLSKQTQTGVNKQTDVVGVQTPVQTAVQTGILDRLTIMERAIVWALINSDMKLSYEDLSALLGKEKSTIRGQINSIKRKSESLIIESREATGKKRVYIPEDVKNLIVKSVKVRVGRKKKSENSEKKQKSEGSGV